MTVSEAIVTLNANAVIACERAGFDSATIKMIEDALDTIEDALKVQETMTIASTELTDVELIEKIREAPIVLKPNADTAQVVHGRWINENPDDFLDPRMRCSICAEIESPLIKWRYCPNCGAKMD